MPIQIPSPGMVKGGGPTIGSAPDAPRSFFAGRGINVPQNRVRASASAFGGGQGAEAVNKALSGVLSQYGDELVRMKEIENEGVVLNKSIELGLAIAETKNKIKTSASPSEWFSDFQKAGPGIESSLITQDMPPAVQREVRSNFSKQYGATSISLLQEGATETTRQTRETKLYASEQNYLMGRFEEGDVILSDMVSKKMLTQTAADKIKNGYLAQHEYALGLQAAQTDPYSMERMLKDGKSFPQLTPMAKSQLWRATQTGKSNLQKSVMADIKSRFDTNDPSQYPTNDYIDSIEWLDKRTKKNLKDKYFDAFPKVNDLEEISSAQEMIQGYDPEKDYWGLEKAKIERFLYASFGEKKEEEFLGFLEERSDFKKKQATQPKVDALKRLDGLLSSGGIGKQLVDEDGDFLSAAEPDQKRKIAQIKDENLKMVQDIKTAYNLWWDNASPEERRTKADSEMSRLINNPVRRSRLLKMPSTLMQGVKGTSGKSGTLFNPGSSAIKPLTTAYRPAPKGTSNAAFGLSDTVEGGENDAHGNLVWGKTTFEDYAAGRGDYVTVAMDIESPLFKKKAWLKSPSFPGVVFRVMDNGGFGNKKTGNTWVDIASSDPVAAGRKGVFDREIVYEEITEKEAKAIRAQSQPFESKLVQ